MVGSGKQRRRTCVFLDGSGNPVKECNACSFVFPVSRYNKCAKAPGGIERICPPCRAAKRAPFKQAESAARMATYHANHAESLAAQREYQRNNRHVYRDACARWRAQNPEKQKQATDRWNKENPHINAAAAMRYYTRKKQRCPAWLTPEHHQQIEAFYSEARRVTKETGIKHVVDHIVPLQGETVSGLHVPWNLQILTAIENVRKWNRWSSDDALDPPRGSDIG